MAIKVYFGAQPAQYQSELEMQTYQPTWIELSGVDGLEDFEITFRKANSEDDSNNVTQESISKELNFFDGSRNFLHEQLVVQKRELVYVKVEDDCPDCGLLHFGVIKRKNLKSCDCDDFYSAQINGISKDEIIKARLESIVVMNTDLASYYNPADSANTNTLFQMVQERPSGTRLIDRYAIPAIPIRRIFNDISSRLAMTAYSSIFFEYNRINDWSGDDYTPTQIPSGYNQYNPYFYLYLSYFPILSQSKKQEQQGIGQNPDDQNNNTYFAGGNWRPIKKENWLSWSAFAFFNRLAEVFNAQWRIRNGHLEFERKDYFSLGENLWLDLTNEKVCYAIQDFTDFAYLDIGFAGSRGEVQSSLNPRSAVVCQSAIQQNPFIDLSTERLESLVDWQTQLSFVRKQGLIKRFEFGYAPAVRYDGRNKIGLKDGTTPYPILLTRAENSAINRAFIWGDIGVLQHQNMTTDKYLFNHCTGEYTTDLIKENLYDNFHFIDDPNQSANSKGYFSKSRQLIYSFNIEEVPFNCTNFNNFDINKTVNTKRGLGIMEEVTFNWSRKTVSIQGRV